MFSLNKEVEQKNTHVHALESQISVLKQQLEKQKLI